MLSKLYRKIGGNPHYHHNKQGVGLSTGPEVGRDDVGDDVAHRFPKSEVGEGRFFTTREEDAVVSWKMMIRVHMTFMCFQLTLYNVYLYIILM